MELRPPQTTLPWSSYASGDALATEQEQIFRPAWHYVGHAGMLAGPHGAFPAAVAGVPVVITRAGDELRAFVNVCRHRGSVVCLEPGSRTTLQCPYHAWTYGLDGTLRSAPRSDRESTFDPAEHSLEELPFGRWGPFLFVAVGAAPPFTDVLADLPERVAEAGVDVDQLAFHHRWESAIEANWKLVVENFLECYHCRVAHPAFSRILDTGPDDYRLVTAPTYSSQYGPVRNDWSGDLDPRGPVERGQFHLLLPNIAINVFPGHPNLSIGPIDPVAPGRTSRFLDYFFGADVEEDWIEDMLAFDDRVGAEDVALVEAVQRGMEAGVHSHGTLFLDSERLIAHFHAWLRDRLA